MSDTRFDGPPKNGTEVFIGPSGVAITPYRVTVIRDGDLVRSEDFTLRSDAERLYKREMQAMTDAART